jgi:hypothetical protein
MNLPETTTDRNPSGVPDRRSHQCVRPDRRSHKCARPGWRPRRRTPRQLARDIAESILQHRAAGDARWMQPSDFTTDAETQALVRQLLATDATSQQ